VKNSAGTLPIWQFADATAPAGSVATLDAAQLAPIVDEAKALWAQALGADDPRLARLNGITVEVGNLPDLGLGETNGDTILIDSNAAGWGWFVDATPGDNSEFTLTLPSGALATATGPAAGHMDLLTTVLHEMGNAMGFAEDTNQDVTGMVLSAGVRTLPGVNPPASTGAGNAGTQLDPTLTPPGFTLGFSVDSNPLAGVPAFGNWDGALPAVQWDSSFFGGSGPGKPDDGGSGWLSDFLNHSGQTQAERNPNLGIRVQTGAGSRISSNIGSL